MFVGSGQLYRSLYEALDVTDVGIIMGEVDEDDVDELYNLYLNDFVRHVHKSSHKTKLCDMEYKVCIFCCSFITSTIFFLC